METWNLLIEIVALLAVCLLFGGVLSRLRQSPLVGYLLAGMLLAGPGSLGLIRAESNIESIAELGVSLLLFSLGLEFSWERLRGLGTRSLAAGVAQVLSTGVAIAGLCLLFGLGAAEAVALGAMLSLSSTAAVLRVLMDRAEIDALHGKNSLAILLIQDMAVVPLAVLMTLLAGGGRPAEILIDVGRILLLAAVLIAGLYLLLNKVAVRALESLSVEQNRELTVLLAVVVSFGSAWSAHAAGISPALGAFVGGMFLGASPFATQIRADVASLRVVLLTLFFGAVGMVADPIWIAGNLPFVLSMSALLVAVKAVLIWGVLRLCGHSEGVSAATALCLSQVGEFAFVLGTTAKSGGVIDEETYTLVVSIAIVTLLLTPYFVSAAPRVSYLMERLRGRRLLPADSDRGATAEVVIVGFGPAGQAVGRELAERGESVVVLDLNPAAARAAAALGFSGLIGDATQTDVLRHAGATTARLVVITLPARSAALAVLQHVRRMAPAASLVVRSRYQIHKRDFENAGADAVIGDEEEVGRQLSIEAVGELTRLRAGREKEPERIGSEHSGR